jgi:glycosyltransferase involved in cell wall biosynthesis
VASLKRWVNARTFALARRIVVWSTWVKESLIADYGVREEVIRVIPPGVDLAQWGHDDRAADEAVAMDAGETDALPRVLFVGGDFRRKGGHLLLDWYRTDGRGRCELHLVTRDPVAPEPGVYVHHGIVGNSPEARALFHAADVFVLPSLGECFGIASVEAMAAGLPVITTQVGGSGDIVDDGVTGFLVPPDDRRALGTALDRLVSDPALRRQMGRRGRARAERRFDAVANARALLQCVSEAVAEEQFRRERRTRPTGVGAVARVLARRPRSRSTGTAASEAAVP